MKRLSGFVLISTLIFGASVGNNDNIKESNTTKVKRVYNIANKDCNCTKLTHIKSKDGTTIVLAYCNTKTK